MIIIIIKLFIDMIFDDTKWGLPRMAYPQIIQVMTNLVLKLWF